MTPPSILAAHRCIREFRSEPIPPELLDGLLRVAQGASTDATAQMATLIRIVDPELRGWIARLSGEQRHVSEAAEFFVVCADIHRLGLVLKARGLTPGRFPAIGLHFATLDAAFVAQRLMDAAEAAGLGVCCIGGILDSAEELTERLALPTGVVPLFGLCLGVPAEDPPARPRIAIESMVHTDRYQAYPDERLEADIAGMAPITSSGDWVQVLQSYFASSGIMEDREWPWRRVLARQEFSSGCE